MQAATLTEEEQKIFDNMRDDKPAEEPKAEAAKPETAPKAEPEKQEQKTVPHAALAEARAENRDLRRDMEALRKQLADGDGKLKTLMQEIQKRADAPAAPRFEDDPAGNLKYKNEQLEKDLADLKNRLAARDAAEQQGNQLGKFTAFVAAKEKDFAKDNPDYYKATEYVSKVWGDEFAEAGYDNENIPQMVFQKSVAITNQAAQKGKDPAAAIYSIAKRYGYQVEKQKSDEPKDGDKPAGETKLEAIRKGQDAARTTGGSDAPEEFSIAALSQMSEDQIERAVKDPDWWSKNIRNNPLR